MMERWEEIKEIINNNIDKQNYVISSDKKEDIIFKKDLEIIRKYIKKGIDNLDPIEKNDYNSKIKNVNYYLDINKWK